MNAKPFVCAPGDRKPGLNVIGTTVTVLASGEDIEDQQITLQSGNEGMGPPPHSHDWDESFYVTKGLIEFTCAGHTSMCSAGTLVHVPAGTVHAFLYGPGGGEMLEITGKRSNAVTMFTALDREIPQVHRTSRRWFRCSANTASRFTFDYKAKLRSARSLRGFFAFQGAPCEQVTELYAVCPEPPRL